MKHSKKLVKTYIHANFNKEDARILQRSVTGKSVYKSVEKLYRRTPKHRQSLTNYSVQ